jgi:outer membrane receptor protein involved in Fe transport
MNPRMSKLSGRARTILLGTTMLAGAVAVATPALAQQAGVETVVVTGIRASLQSAQAIKQNSDQVVDSITAVDIGALPDRSVAEALQRVPGVQVTRTDQIHDPLRWAGFGNGVFIRGLSWVSSLTNGFDTFGAENGRTVSFADVSPSLMAGVDVYKNPDATMIEGGVGGVVNLKTRKPFDQDGRVIAFGAEYAYGSISEKFAPSANILVSDRWDTKIGEIGVLLSGDYQDLRASNGLVSLGPFTGQGTVGSQTVYYPVGLTSDEQVGYRHMDWKQPRVTLDGTVQWRPNEKLEFTAIAIWTKAEPQSNEHNVAWDLYPVTPQTNASALPNYKYNSRGDFIGGTIFNAFENSSYANYFDSRFDARHHINGNYSLGMKYDPTDRLHITADVEYIDSRAYMYSVTMYNSFKYNGWCHFPENGWSGPGYSNALPPPAVGSTPSGCYNGSAQAQEAKYWPGAPVINVTSDLSDDSPKITYGSGNAAALADPSNYLWAASMDHVENNYAHSWAGRVGATYDLDGPIAKWVKSIEVGGRVDLKQAVSRRSNWNWGKSTFKIWSNGWTGVPGAPAGYTANPACLNDPARTGSAATKATLCQEVAGIGDFSNSLSSPFVYKYNFPALFGTNMPAVWEANPAWLQKGIGAVWKGIKPIEQNAHDLAGIAMWAPGAARNSGAMWAPLSVKAGCDINQVEYLCNNIYNTTNPTSNGGGINEQTENTYAGYAQFDYAHDDFFGWDMPIDGNFGVRVIRTETTSTGYVILGNVATCPSGLRQGANPATDCAGVIEARNFLNNGGIFDPAHADQSLGDDANSIKTTAPEVDSSYTDILPSFNFRAHLSDTLQARVAYSQGVVRPDFSNSQNYTLYGFNFNNGQMIGCTGTGATKVCTGNRGSGGNPHLKPLHSENYDASLEWFFAPTGSLSLAMFYKDISDYFMSATSNETFVHNNISETFQVTRYVNGDKGTLKGMELAYQQFYDFLPGAFGGFGVQANYTKLWNHGGHNTATNINNTGLGNSTVGVALANNEALPMEGMSDDSFNLALMYAKYDIDARLAYNWRSRFLVNSSAVNLNEPVFQRNYGQLDGSILYSFLDHYKIGFQASNILKQTTVLEIGGIGDPANLPITHTPKYEWVEGERKFSVVIRANW